MQNSIEAKVLRIAHRMSPKRESYPLDIKVWEENLRSGIPKITYSDYYILNPPEPSGAKSNYKGLNHENLTSHSKQISEPSNPFIPKGQSSPLKSDFMTTAASKAFYSSPIKSESDYNKKILALEQENQKCIEMCNAEIKRHTAEKVKNI